MAGAGVQAGAPSKSTPAFSTASADAGDSERAKPQSKTTAGISLQSLSGGAVGECCIVTVR